MWAAAFLHLLSGIFVCGELGPAGCVWWVLKEVQQKRQRRDEVKKPFLKRSDLEAKNRRRRSSSSSSSDTEREERREKGVVGVVFEVGCCFGFLGERESIDRRRRRRCQEC
jgi:hypothetical protein